MNNYNTTIIFLMGKMMFSWKILVLFIFSAPVIAETTPPSGMPDGGCWAGIENSFAVPSSIGANKGSNISTGGGRIDSARSIFCYASSDNYLHKHTSYIAAEVDPLLPPSDINPGYYKFTDDLDIKIKLAAVNIPSGGFPSDYNITTPVMDYRVNNEYPIVKTGVNSKYIGFSIWSLNNFVVRRNIIGGAAFVPAGIRTLKVYHYFGLGQRSSIPIFSVTSRASIIKSNAECKINNGSLIKIDFSSVDNTLLTDSYLTSPYVKPASLQYHCATPLTQDIKVILFAEAAGYSDAIKTSNQDIGVVMTRSGQVVPPHTSFNSRLVNGQGNDEVKFTVVKNPAVATVATGPFENNNTVLIISTL